MTYGVPVRAWDWYSDSSVVLVDVPLACCGLEVEAAVPATAREVAWDAPATHRIVTVSGTVTNQVAYEVAELVQQVSALGPATVVAFGACTAGGGPYWDSYSVLKGLDQVLEVDRYVPGCPPSPAALASLVEEVCGG